MMKGEDLTKDDCAKICRDEFMHMDHNQLVEHALEVERNAGTFLETYQEWWDEQDEKTQQEIIDKLKLGQ